MTSLGKAQGDWAQSLRSRIAKLDLQIAAATSGFGREQVPTASQRFYTRLRDSRAQSKIDDLSLRHSDIAPALALSE